SRAHLPPCQASPVRSSGRKPARFHQNQRCLRGAFMIVHSNFTKVRAMTGASLGVLGAMLLMAPAQAQDNSAPVQLGPVTVNDNADKNGLTHTPPVSTMPSTSVQDT